MVGLVGTYIGSFSTVLHSLLEVTDHAGYGMKSSIAGNIAGLLSFFVYIKVSPDSPKSIVWVEIIWTILEVVILAIDLLVTKQMRWFDDFWKGAFLKKTEYELHVGTTLWNCKKSWFL